MSVRFVSANLLHGRSLTDGLVDVDRMKQAIAELDADVLALQEVDRGQARSGEVDQTGVIAAAMGEASWRFVPAIIGEPGASWRAATAEDLPSGHDLETVVAPVQSYGTGLVIRGPVERWHVIRVRPFPRRAPVFIPGVNRWMFIDDEPRVCIAAQIQTPWGPMTVAATHLSFVPGWNIPQLRQIVRALSCLPGPTLLLGDLNLPAPIPAMVSRWTALAPGLPTFPAPSPRMQLDHALLHDPLGAFPSKVSSSAREMTFSDHRALVVDAG